MDAGRLDRRLRFEKRQDVENGAGGYRSDWVQQFECAANRKWLRGGEGVMSARLENRQMVVLTIRACVQARQIDNDWRAVDTRDGRVYNVREVPRETDGRALLEMLAEAGVAS